MKESITWQTVFFALSVAVVAGVSLVFYGRYVTRHSRHLREMLEAESARRTAEINAAKGTRLAPARSARATITLKAAGPVNSDRSNEGGDHRPG